MRRLGGVTCAAFAAVAVSAAALTAQADTAAAPRWATITFLNGGTAYLEVGRRHGVREGTRFTVVRAGNAVAELEAEYVSSTRTASRMLDSTAVVAVGDSVWYLPVQVEAPVVAASGQPVTSSPTRSRSGHALRGRVGLRYLVIDQGTGRSIRQPGFDLRLEGAQLGGSGLGLALDVRVQRRSVSGGDGSTAPSGQTRVYQASARYQRHPNGSRLVLGRQFATALSPVGIFDGLAADLQGAAWSGGLLVGTQPDAVSFAPDGETVEYGAWVQRHSRSGGTVNWSLTLGAIGSYDRGEIDREFAYLRGTYASRRLTVFAAQEVDVNRGWRRQEAGAPATLTASLVTAHLRLSDAVQLAGGFDSRQRVRLYRDFVNPEITFDDALRRGQWGEVAVRPSGHVRLSAGMRRSATGSEGASRSVTGSAAVSRLTSLGLGARARFTEYRGPLSSGTLASVAVEAAPNAGWRLSLNGGVRTSRSASAGGSAARLTWTGADIDVSLGRRVYLMLSGYREQGSGVTSRQLLGSVTWRF